MSASWLSAGDLVAHFGESTVARHERAMPPGFFVPRKNASAEPQDASDATNAAGRAEPRPCQELSGDGAMRSHSGTSPVVRARDSANQASALNDAALLAAMLRYAQGDNRAFDDVYAQLAPRLHGFCVRLCAGSTEADDLLQETLLKLHRSRTAYRPEANPLHWAFAIARCAYIDRVRRRKVRPEVLGSSHSALATKPSDSEPESELRAAQLRELVHAVLLAQPEAARTSYILVRLEGVCVADAATILSASADAIKQRVHRVAQALREQLQRRGLDGNP